MTVIDEVKPQDLHSESFWGNPFPYYAWLREHQPMIWESEVEAWLLTRYTDVLRIFTDAEHFSARSKARATRPVFGPNLGIMDGAEHTNRRTVVAPELMGARLADFVPRIEELAEELVDDFAALGQVDLVKGLTSRLPATTISTLLGLPVADHDRLYRWYRTMISGMTDRTKRVAGADARRELCAYAEPIIRDRMSCPEGDIISRIITSDSDAHTYTVEDLQGFIAHLFAAGGETTDSALASMWSNLLTDPEQFEAVLKDPELWDNVFSETLRRDPPLPGGTPTREVIEPVEIHGQKLWPGEVVATSILSANNDETVFADPRKFDIFRSDLHLARELRNPTRLLTEGKAGHLSFHAGEHFCMGYQLARTEAVVASKVMARKLRNIRLAPGATPVLEHTVGGWSIRSLPIVFDIA